MIQTQLKLETLNPDTILSHKSLHGTAKNTVQFIDFCNYKIKKKYMEYHFRTHNIQGNEMASGCERNRRGRRWEIVIWKFYNLR